MIEKDLIFLLVYEKYEFVDFSNGESPTPSGYTRTQEVIEYFNTIPEMNKFIEEKIVGKSYIYGYKTFHCFPTSKKIELNEFKPFSR